MMPTLPTPDRSGSQIRLLPSGASFGDSESQFCGGDESLLQFAAELGAHSTTNFYKGLSGNDVIDSGGIFVATYQIPEIGRQLSLKVSMPGGYEFEAIGVVRWTREAPNSGSDSSPGFGAQFTQISPEGRQLVYRYVRNRNELLRLAAFQLTLNRRLPDETHAHWSQLA